MAQVLAEGFRVFDVDVFAAVFGMAFHGGGVFVHPMMRHQPISLAFVAAEHLLLRVHCRGDIHIHRRGDGFTEDVLALHRIGIIQIRRKAIRFSTGVSTLGMPQAKQAVRTRCEVFS